MTHELTAIKRAQAPTTRHLPLTPDLFECFSPSYSDDTISPVRPELFHQLPRLRVASGTFARDPNSSSTSTTIMQVPVEILAQVIENLGDIALLEELLNLRLASSKRYLPS